MGESHECRDCGRKARYFWPDGRAYCGPCNKAALKFRVEVLKASKAKNGSKA